MVAIVLIDVMILLALLLGFLNLTKSDVNAPVNVRCYDLVSEKSSSGVPVRFRIFACFAEAGTPDGYRQAKYAIRKWYEESGRRTSLEQPYAGALIVGASSPWPADMLPNSQVFMLKVRGDSMIEAGILDGDQVIVKQTNQASNGDMVVALIEDGATVKTFYKEKDHIRLQPENPDYDPIIVSDVQILGQVIGVFRMF